MIYLAMRALRPAFALPIAIARSNNDRKEQQVALRQGTVRS
jgi:hypothetical protein